MSLGRFQTLLGAAALAGAALGPVSAFAGPSYSVTVSEGLANGNGFTTTNTSPFSGANTASAAFTYTGALAFSDTQSQNNGPGGDLNSTFGFTTGNISGYTGSGTVVQGSTPIANYNTLADFLGSSGSASGYQYGSFYSFDLGVLAAGTTLTIAHDDGISLYQGGVNLGQTTAGPTSQVTDTIKISSTADTFLYYSRQNGTPSVLNVAVPEPATIGVLAAGLLGLCFMRRRYS